jgi:DNA-binding NtrC family response regulator
MRGERLEAAKWPGNVRQLPNAIEAAMIRASESARPRARDVTFVPERKGDRVARGSRRENAPSGAPALRGRVPPAGASRRTLKVVEDAKSRDVARIRRSYKLINVHARATQKYARFS